MESDQLNSGAASLIGAVDAAPEDGSSTGSEPAVYHTVSHALGGLSAIPADQSAIRHHERQLCATELLILAERHADTYVAGQLILAAVGISRREVV